MSLSKGKARLSIKAVKKFTNRDEPKASFFNALNGLLTGERPYKVLMYYGVGGIGKSSLMKHLSQSILNDSIISVFINLEASNYSSFADILIDIRRSLPAQFPIFEYALVRYLARQGRSLKDISISGLPKDSLLFDFLDLAADLAEVVAPARLIKRLYDLGHSRIQRLLSKYKTKFEEIDVLPDEQLEEMLSVYLGLELEIFISNSSKKLVFFFDTHDAMSWRTAFKSTKHVNDFWLCELIGSIGSGLYIIAGRERLKWVEQNPEWETVLEQHMLGRLSDIDANEFLFSIPIMEQPIREAIIKSAEGVPLYLDLCAETYLLRKNSGVALNPEAFRLHEKQVIERFLAHLDRDWEQTLRLLSIPNIFDFDLFSEIIREMNVGFPFSLYGEFCESSYIVSVQLRNSTFKVHDIVRNYIIDETSDDIKVKILRCMLKSSEKSKNDNQTLRALWLFEQIFLTINTFNLKLLDSEVWRLLDLAIVLIDRGHWTSVQQAVQQLLKKSEDYSKINPLDAMKLYVMAYCERKKGHLHEANDLYEKATANEEIYNKYKQLLKYHSAHVLHLLGHFNLAIGLYEEVVCSQGDSCAQKYARQLAERQLVDVAMIQGRFKSAEIKFDHLEKIDQDPLWIAEIYRFKGHIARFNTHYAEAEKLYLGAKSIAESIMADAMLGKALTNLAETKCWIAPETALEMANKAIDLNNLVPAPIEVGKATTAKSLALCYAGHYEDAIKIAKQSKEIQENNGYINGTLYALQAEGIARHFLQQSDKVASICTEMEVISNKLGVYGFLRLPLLLTLDPKLALKEYLKYEWLDIDEVIGRHKMLMKI
jgi:tetratricopeptide (TPR) repeat protein